MPHRAREGASLSSTAWPHILRPYGTMRRLPSWAAVLTVALSVTMAPASATTFVGATHRQAQAAANSQIWRVAETPAVAGSIVGVSCPTVSYCVAVGNRDSGHLPGPFMEVWQRGLWQLDPLPRADGAVLTGVSCRGTGTCLAVGQAAGWG